MTEPHDVAVLLAEAAAFLVRWKSDPYDCALVGGLAAALRESDTELRSIDNVLARRPALADCRSRGEAVEKAISVASKADRLERQLTDAAVLVYRDIQEERERQTAQWGGPPHDDDHSAVEWRSYRLKFETRIGLGCGADVRTSLVKIAALAVAQIEAYDRRDKALPPRPAPKEATV